MGCEAAPLPAFNSLEARPSQGLEWSGGARVEGEGAVPVEQAREIGQGSAEVLVLVAHSCKLDPKASWLAGYHRAPGSAP